MRNGIEGYEVSSSVDRLVVEVHEATRGFLGADPGGLAEQMRTAAVSAAELLAREGGLFASEVRSCEPRERLLAARRRLGEVSAGVDLAEQLGLLTPADAIGLFERVLGANIELARRLDATLAVDRLAA